MKKFLIPIGMFALLGLLLASAVAGGVRAGTTHLAKRAVYVGCGAGEISQDFSAGSVSVRC